MTTPFVASAGVVDASVVSAVQVNGSTEAAARWHVSSRGRSSPSVATGLRVTAATPTAGDHTVSLGPTLPQPNGVQHAYTASSSATQSRWRVLTRALLWKTTAQRSQQHVRPPALVSRS